MKKKSNAQPSHNHPLVQSEERYKAFISQSTEGIWRCELEKPLSIKISIKKQLDHIFKYGYLAECNDAMAKMYGFKKAEELIGARLSDLLIPTESKNIEYLTAFIKSGYKLGYTESHEQDTFGNLHIFENNLIGIIQDGFVLRAWGTQRDITQQKKTRERQDFLNKVSNKLVMSLNQEVTLKEIAQLVVPYLADYCRIATIDEDNIIKELTVNHKDPTKINLAEALFDNYKNDPQRTYGIPTIIKSGKPEIIEKIDTKILKKFHTSPKLIAIVKELELKSYMGVPLIARDKVIGAMTFSSVKENRYYTKDDLAFAMELAGRIALTLDNIHLFKESQEAISLRDEFISVASHELKTPITSMKIFTQILQKNAELDKDSKTLPTLEKMDRQINKLTELIYNLLDISKIQAGRLEYTMKDFSFDEMIKDLIEIHQHISTRHTLVLKNNRKQTIYGDEDRLSQVVSNLITNAIKYSPNAKSIEIKITSSKKFIKVAVKDSGIGMSKEHFDKIFNRFYRVSDSDDQTYPGLGIGLYICKEIITRHQGNLWVESFPDKGSIFYFTLPKL